MGNKRRYQKLRVQMKYVPAPDVRERLSRALGILLKAATRNTSQSKERLNAKKEGPPHQATEEDALTAGDGEQKNGNEGKLPHD